MKFQNDSYPHFFLQMSLPVKVGQIRRVWEYKLSEISYISEACVFADRTFAFTFLF